MAIRNDLRRILSAIEHGDPQATEQLRPANPQTQIEESACFVYPPHRVSRVGPDAGKATWMCDFTL